MSCNSCTRKYGFFCKEVGCPSCGFSFCTKCLKKEAEVPKCGGVKLRICVRCFEKIEKEKTQQKITPEAIVNDVLTIKDESLPLEAPLEPIHLGKPEIPPGDNEDDDDEDNVIADNLDYVISKKLSMLKGTDSEVAALPGDGDLAARLSNLKGVPHKEYTNKDVLLATDTRTEKEKIDDLLKQFVEERTIDEEAAAALDPISDIERRLALLKGDYVPNEGPQPSTSKMVTLPDEKTEENEEGEIKKVLEKFLEEAKLPDALITPEEQELVSSLPPPSKDTEELPWCTICNEDAKLRCLGCDGDLFCAQCFRDCHDDEDFRQHTSQPYEKPPTFKENHF